RRYSRCRCSGSGMRGYRCRCHCTSRFRSPDSDPVAIQNNMRPVGKSQFGSIVGVVIRLIEVAPVGIIEPCLHLARLGSRCNEASLVLKADLQVGIGIRCTWIKFGKGSTEIVASDDGPVTTEYQWAGLTSRKVVAKLQFTQRYSTNAHIHNIKKGPDLI